MSLRSLLLLPLFASLSVSGESFAELNRVTSYSAIAIVETGGQYENPRDAVDELASWCASPSAANRCLISVRPGKYDVGDGTEFTLPSFVDLAGSGPDFTLLTAINSGAGIYAATVICEPDVRIRDIAIHNEAGSLPNSFAIGHINSGRLELSNIRAQSKGGNQTVAIHTRGQTHIDDSTAIAVEGSVRTVAWWIDDDSEIQSSHSKFVATSDALLARGIQIDPESRGTISYASIKATGTSNGTGIHAVSSAMSILNSEITGKSPTKAVALSVGSSVSAEGNYRITRSSLLATSANDQAVGLHVMRSEPGTPSPTRVSFLDGFIEACGSPGASNGLLSWYGDIKVEDSHVGLCNPGKALGIYDTTTLHVTLSHVTGRVYEDPGTNIRCTAITDGDGVFYADSCPDQRSVAVANVLHYGAKPGDGLSDQNAIEKALQAVRNYGTVFFPAGNYIVGRTIRIDKPVNIRGEGAGTQIFQYNSNRSLFHFDGLQQPGGLNGITVEDLFLGSAGTGPEPSYPPQCVTPQPQPLPDASPSSLPALIRLTNTHRSQFNNITMLGGYYGVHLQGSMINTFVNLKSASNYSRHFFRCPAGGPCKTPINKYWVKLETFDVDPRDVDPVTGEKLVRYIASNANTFLGVGLEGGTNGLLVSDCPPTSVSPQSNVYIVGGTIEGAINDGLRIIGSFNPSLISGVHFEQNGKADIVLQDAANVHLQSLLGDGQTRLTGTTRSTSILSSALDRIDIGEDVTRTRLDNVVRNASGNSPVFPNRAPDTIAINVADNAGGNATYQSRIGVWDTRALLDSKIEVDGNLGVGGLLLRSATGTEHLRLYAEGGEVYVEDSSNGIIYRLVREP